MSEAKEAMLVAGMVGAATMAFVTWLVTGPKPQRHQRKSRYKRNDAVALGLPTASSETL